MCDIVWILCGFAATSLNIWVSDFSWSDTFKAWENCHYAQAIHIYRSRLTFYNSMSCSLMRVVQYQITILIDNTQNMLMLWHWKKKKPKQICIFLAWYQIDMSIWYRSDWKPPNQNIDCFLLLFYLIYGPFIYNAKCFTFQKNSLSTFKNP